MTHSTKESQRRESVRYAKKAKIKTEAMRQLINK
jgi:hypothetical protein